MYQLRRASRRIAATQCRFHLCTGTRVYSQAKDQVGNPMQKFLATDGQGMVMGKGKIDPMFLPPHGQESTSQWTGDHFGAIGLFEKVVYTQSSGDGHVESGQSSFLANDVARDLVEQAASSAKSAKNEMRVHPLAFSIAQALRFDCKSLRIDQPAILGKNAACGKWVILRSYREDDRPVPPSKNKPLKPYVVNMRPDILINAKIYSMETEEFDWVTSDISLSPKNADLACIVLVNNRPFFCMETKLRSRGTASQMAAIGQSSMYNAMLARARAIKSGGEVNDVILPNVLVEQERALLLKTRFSRRWLAAVETGEFGCIEEKDLPVVEVVCKEYTDGYCVGYDLSTENEWLLFLTMLSDCTIVPFKKGVFNKHLEEMPPVDDDDGGAFMDISSRFLLA